MGPGRPELKPIKHGDRFGLLVALSIDKPAYDRRGYPVKRWLCQCDCGVKSVVRATALKSGNTESCGCQSSRATMAHRTTIHGHTAQGKTSPEFRAWCKINERCHDKNSKDYSGWGGRGVSAYPEWRHDFLAFYNHVGPKPSSKHSIDRYPNNEGNYEPGNVRWATSEEQARNRRSNRHLTYRGKTRCIREWEEVLGLNKGILKARLHLGWEGERLFQPRIVKRTEAI
jgi:hypothetical protein